MTYLSAIPIPLESESLCSWIHRVCQIYDLTLQRFYATFGIKAVADPDLCLSEKDIERISVMCRIPKEKFSFILDCFCRLTTQPILQDLLSRQSENKPLYRFCIECWKADPIPFLRLEWRFKEWRVCPTHEVLMQTLCPSCRKPLQIHRSVLGGTFSPPPVHTLAECLICRADFRKHEVPTYLYPSTFKKDDLNFQRAVVSAVLHGYFLLPGSNFRRSLTGFMSFINSFHQNNNDNHTVRALNNLSVTSPKQLGLFFEEVCVEISKLKLLKLNEGDKKLLDI